MLISKLPQKIDPVLPKSTSLAKKREFLTKPSSFAKLGVMILLVMVIFWINIKSNKHSTITKEQETPRARGSSEPMAITKSNTETGQVAGVESSRVEVGDVTKQNQAQPQIEVKKPEPPKKEQPKKAQPTKAQTALEKIIGKADDLEVLLETGKNSLDKNDFVTAQLAFKRATEVAPEYRDAWYLLGFTYLKEYQQNPDPHPADYSVSNIDWAIIALKHAQFIDPQAQNVKDLLDTANKVKEETK